MSFYMYSIFINANQMPIHFSSLYNIVNSNYKGNFDMDKTSTMGKPGYDDLLSIYNPYIYAVCWLGLCDNLLRHFGT